MKNNNDNFIVDTQKRKNIIESYISTQVMTMIYKIEFL